MQFMVKPSKCVTFNDNVIDGMDDVWRKREFLSFVYHGSSPVFPLCRDVNDYHLFNHNSHQVD